MKGIHPDDPFYSVSISDQEFCTRVRIIPDHIASHTASHRVNLHTTDPGYRGR